MITFLEGELVEALPTQVVINVGGVGYQVMIPLSSYSKLPAVGQRLRLLTHLVVREDAHLLYGFASTAERDLFRLLIAHVSGVGPKLGLAVLSGMSVEAFKGAVVAGDLASIARISGLGKKTAERIVVELKDKLGVAAEWEAASAAHGPSASELAMHDAVLALISLGYKQIEAHKAVKQAGQSAASKGAPLSSEELLRAALQLLA
jgi:Holliday junction DNA helicase RuvA